MRSLLSWLGIGKETTPPGIVGKPPEMLRQWTLSSNYRFVLLFGMLSVPLALPSLLQGSMLPFVLSIITLAAGFASFALHRRGQLERSAGLHVDAILLLGALLTLANPQFVDFGLGVTLLAPVYASLSGRNDLQRRSWIAVGVIVLLDALRAAGFVGWPEAYPTGLGLAALAFAGCVLLTAHSAYRVNRLFATYERAQINAFRHLIENVQDSVLRFAPDGKVKFASQSTETLLGCKRYELVGQDLLGRIHLLDRPAFMTAFAEANADGKTRRVEVRMRRDDPQAPTAAPCFVWVETSFSPVIDEIASGTRYDVVALLRDVTDRKRHEDELRRARKTAEEALEAKSRFLATIGHELRTPLNAIVGFSEMMTSGVVGDLSPQHREYAQLIHQSGDHLLGVVRMLLDMSRLEAGKFELHAESFAPESLVEPCLTMVEPLARERNIRLMTDLPRILPELTADERVCRQILINLLSNAIKFSHEHSVVTLSMKRQARHLLISVSDQGIGMDEVALRRVGEPFFQVHDGLARRYEGTGLGLSIVKGLVELHGGSLRATSTVGEGTVMTVLLPINGPETKLVETGAVTPLHREPVHKPMSVWPDVERRKAQ